MDKHLHIITHQVPWPADFGGLVDLLYKIRTLSALGVHIHLHCFTTDGNQQPELEKWCVEVKYYKRKKQFSSLSFRLPFIVSSRNDPALRDELEKDHHPVLFEGIHCSYLLNKGYLKQRKVFLRLHNVEYIYYRELAKHERNLFRKFYYRWESRLLHKYEKAIVNKATLFSVSSRDVEVFEKEFGATDIHFLPVFVANSKVDILKGKGFFCLYHGNLAIIENEKAAAWLINEVFQGLDIPFVIAGKMPSEELEALAHKAPHVCMVTNPSEGELHDLLQKAQIHVLPSFNRTGVKLKVLNALFNGRHCLVNEKATMGSAIDPLCSFAHAKEDFKNKIQALFQEDFSEEMIRKRKEFLEPIYNNEKNGRKLISWIY